MAKTKAEKTEAKTVETKVETVVTTVSTDPVVVATENEMEADPLVKELQEKLAAAEAKVAALAEKNSALVLTRAEQKSVIEQLEKKIAALEKVKPEETVAAKNCVHLDGKQWEIVHRNTVKELVQDFFKKEVDETFTAVVIRKIGG